ncbi:unnamed protein product [Mytilus coruscus]|uniref:DZIP3-like HEPN domain-containing protein n=1 Tax=Mytilus coruscus TaxID=42192 RepID=A0A6J8DJF6_MYTCO|nr:unnamed protein product [Mytilus coruscus]
MRIIQYQKLKIAFSWKLSVFLICVFSVESYNLKCPSLAASKLRAQVKCNSTVKYFCLYNNVEEKYVEGCNGPDWDRKGSKRIFAGDFSRGICSQKRFQPFIFWTNASINDCIYSKSKCSEEGQIVYNDNSTKDDIACRCDNKKGYSFITTPRNLCFCIPTEEDCSCHVKSCSINMTLSADYSCIRSGFKKKTKCRDIEKYHGTLDENTGVFMENNNFFLSETNSDEVDETTKEKVCIDTFDASCESEQNSDEVDVTTKEKNGIDTFDGSCESTSAYNEQSKITKDEVHFLRIVHLLFSVACPVVRMLFNREIQPNQLRKTLDENKMAMEKRYRKKEKIINDYQWDLMYKNAKGRTVTSNDYDIRLMIYLLCTIANLSVGNLYPVRSDTSISAMLCRIKYIRNEVTQRFERQLSEDQFNQYWDDIGQAVLKLMSSNQLDAVNDQEKKRLIGKTTVIYNLHYRLNVLNPINIDSKSLSRFIDMSERYPAMILQKLISEYCTSTNITMEKLIAKEQHQLYHEGLYTEFCCRCPKQLSSYNDIIPDKKWTVLQEVAPAYRSKQMNDSEQFTPKKNTTYDLSLAKALILHNQDILVYMIRRLCVKGFDNFLMQNKHTLYHHIKKRCSKCSNVLTGKTLITKKEFNKLFMNEFNISCKSNSMDCCCQYSVRNGIKYSDIDDILLSKIFHVAGPIGILNKIEENAFLSYLNWTVDHQPLERANTELLNLITDETFCIDIVKSSSSCEIFQSDTINACRWVSMYLPRQRETIEPSLPVFVREKEGFNVKWIHVPKEIPLPKRTRKLTNISSEENNFLVVVLGFKKIVYPVIKNHFNTHCSDDVLNQMRMNIYEEQTAQHYDSLRKDETRSWKNRVFLTEIQKRQLFPPNKEEWKNVDLKLMIYILKRITKKEETNEYVDQLCIIDNIRREIVQSSSGVLDEKRFNDIIKSIRKAVLYLGGIFYEEKLLHLQHIQNILG